MCVCVCARARASICLSFCLSVSVCVFACRWLHVHVSAYQCSPFLTPDSAIISPNIAHLGCRFSVEAHHSLTNARNPAFYSAPDIACDSSAHGVRSSKLRLYLTAWNRLHPARVETIQNAGLHGTCTVVKLNLRNAHGWGQGEKHALWMRAHHDKHTAVSRLSKGLLDCGVALVRLDRRDLSRKLPAAAKVLEVEGRVHDFDGMRRNFGHVEPGLIAEIRRGH